MFKGRYGRQPRVTRGGEWFNNVQGPTPPPTYETQLARQSSEKEEKLYLIGVLVFWIRSSTIIKYKNTKLIGHTISVKYFMDDNLPMKKSEITSLIV